MAETAVLPKYDYTVEVLFSEKGTSKVFVGFVLPKKESASIIFDSRTFAGSKNLALGFKLHVTRTIGSESKQLVAIDHKPESITDLETVLRKIFSTKNVDNKITGKTHKISFDGEEIGSIRTRVVVDDSSTSLNRNVFRLIIESRVKLNKDQRKEQKKRRRERTAKRKAFLKKKVVVPSSASSSAPATSTSVPAPKAAVPVPTPTATKVSEPKVDKKKKSKKSKKQKKGPTAVVETPKAQLKAY